STRPARSIPRIAGRGWRAWAAAPARILRSRGFTPLAWTRTRTSPGPGAGFGTSISRKGAFGRSRTSAFMVRVSMHPTGIRRHLQTTVLLVTDAPRSGWTGQRRGPGTIAHHSAKEEHPAPSGAPPEDGHGLHRLRRVRHAGGPAGHGCSAARARRRSRRAVRCHLARTADRLDVPSGPHGPLRRLRRGDARRFPYHLGHARRRPPDGRGGPAR